MNMYKDWDFIDIQSGRLQLEFYYEDELIDTLIPPYPLYEDKHIDTISEGSDTILINDVDVEIDIQSSNVGTYVMASCDGNSDINLDNLTITTNYLMTEIEEEYTLNIDTFKYTPVLSHTITTPVVLYNIMEDCENDLIPLLYIEDDSRLNNYKEQDYDFPHFIDLWYIHEVTNEEEIQIRKNENAQRKEIGIKTLKGVPKKYKQSTKADILNYYSDLQNDYVIPVIEIKELVDFGNIKYFKGSTNLALKIVYNIENIEEIINEYYKHLQKFDNVNVWVIFDCDTLHHFDTVNYYINKLASNNSFQIIYLAAPFKSKDISIPRNETNENKYLEDSTLDIYRQLSYSHSNIWYGDYGGFERKTPSKGMGKPTARVVLRSHLQDRIIVRRGWEEADLKDNGNIGYTNSMKRLLGDISKGKISSEFLDENLCDVDYAIKTHGENSISMGNLKTFCFSHNVCSILKKFMK